MISQWSLLSKEMIEDMNGIGLNTFDIGIFKHVSRIGTNFPIKQVLLQVHTLIIFHCVASYSFCTTQFQGEGEGV